MTTYTARLIDTGAQTAERPWGVYASATNGSEWLDGAFASEAEAQAEARRRSDAEKPKAKPTTRTITLSDRRPVKIDDGQWPVIAHGSYSWHDGEVEVQANRRTALDMRVRLHEDGRAIVYGVYTHETAWRGEGNDTQKAGVLVGAGEDVAAAIRGVGERLVEQGVDEKIVRDVVNETVAGLPAESL